MRAAVLVLAALLSACAGARSGWASRGRYEVLYESPTVQVRRGGQKLDAEKGEIVIAWVGARAPDGQPGLVDCSLAVFDDRDADDRPDPGELLSLRENRESTRKVLFSDVRVRAASASRLRAQLVASTPRERCVASWAVAPD